MPNLWPALAGFAFGVLVTWGRMSIHTNELTTRLKNAQISIVRLRKALKNCRNKV